MQVISGILVVDPAHRREGSTTIDFDNIPRDGSKIGNATMGQPILVDGNGGSIVTTTNKGRKFRGRPAYVANIREWIQEDKIRDGLNKTEYDDFIINSNVNSDRLYISWELKDDRGEILEISFMCVGVAV